MRLRPGWTGRAGGNARAEPFAHNVVGLVLFAFAGGLGGENVSCLGIDEPGVVDASSLVKIEPAHSPFLLRPTIFS